MTGKNGVNGFNVMNSRESEKKKNKLFPSKGRLTFFKCLSDFRRFYNISLTSLRDIYSITPAVIQ